MGPAVLYITPDGDLKVSNVSALLPVPSDTTKSYLFKPGTGWIEGPSKANFSARVQAGAYGGLMAIADPLYGFAGGYLQTRTVPIGAGYNETTASQYTDQAETALTITGAGASVDGKNPIFLRTGTTSTGTVTFAVGGSGGLPGGAANLDQYSAITALGFLAQSAPISNGTERYLTESGLSWQGSATPLAWFSQVDNVNSAKWLFNYYDESGVLQTIDTGVTAQGGSTRSYTLTHTWNPATSKFELVASLVGDITWTSSTLTSVKLNTFLGALPSACVFTRITKQLGTTARSIRFQRALVIGTLR